MKENEGKKIKIAIIMLACSDYKAMELSLACHMAFKHKDIPFYILQNCRGSYDSERTFDVGRRYAKLFPDQIKIVDWIPPGNPYDSISSLLNSKEFSNYDLILKVDDDAFPISDGWLDRLIQVWETYEAETPGKLGYVSPLINNNGWGFVEVLKSMGLMELYFKEQAHTHIVGSLFSEENPRRILSKDTIFTGGSGTIWGYPHIARWIHERTTLKPDNFIEATRNLSPIDIPSGDRYSIGCILFRPELWKKINNNSYDPDDEGMMHMYCKKNHLRIICARDVPFVHLAFFTQREENRDIVDNAIKLYETRLGHPFPISLYADKILEIESRLRFIEVKINKNEPRSLSKFNFKSLKKIFKIFINNPKKIINKIIRLKFKSN